MNIFFEALTKVNFGCLIIQFVDGTTKKFGSCTQHIAEIIILDDSIFPAVFFGGDITFGEAYCRNEWTTPDLPALLAFFTINADCLEKFLHQNPWRSFCLYLRCLLHKNTKKGSKKNIQFHYDLGNDFYRLWLDDTMTYSSALFAGQDCDLQQAQIAKYNNIISKLNQGRVLEIGCGWGGFASIACDSGFDVIGLTLSKQQLQYCQQKKIDNFEVKLQDYRDEKQQYNNIVSIEMFEAVGKQYWPIYFQTLNSCLLNNGKAVLQIITIAEDVFTKYQNRIDFIQKHIFPGGILPTKTIIRDLAKQNNLKVLSETNFGNDYAKTLLLWYDKFNNQTEQVLKLGFDQQFIRKWNFYLAYCYAGFISNRIDVVQFELIKTN